MLRRTKIIATLGPATDDPERLRRLIKAGVNLVRVNFSHGGYEEHKRRIEAVRACASELKQEMGILADLQGPKIRVAKFQEGQVLLESGDTFVLDTAWPTDEGTKECVGIDYKELPRDVSPGDRLLLDDGRIHLTVKAVEGERILCEVLVGGVLSNHKGINRQGGGLSAAALTEKDKQDIQSAANLDVDYLAVSFPRSAEDIQEARRLLEEANGKAGIIAKIERVEAVVNIDTIIAVSDAVMVARGDLAVEIGDAEVPAVQKQIIARARALNRPVIVATQMMESMVQSTVPTRAEVSDVANAVLDLTDAVMLSAESAIGEHPAKVVEMMVRVCVAAEKQPETQMSRHRLECEFEQVDEAIAMATVYTANHMQVKAIICLTESGTTPLWMSRIRTDIPIFGLSRQGHTRGKMTLYRDVYPIYFDVTKVAYDEVNRKAVLELEKRGFVEKGDLVILTKGDHMGVHGGTNAMKILEVDSVN